MAAKIYFYGYSRADQRNVHYTFGIKSAMEDKDSWVLISGGDSRDEWFDTPTLGVDRVVVKDKDGVYKVYGELAVFSVPEEGYRLIIGKEYSDAGSNLTGLDVSAPN